MASTGERAFWRSIQQRAFQPVYYLHGEDDFLKAQALRQLIAAAVDEGTRDFNLDNVDAERADAATLGSLLGTPPMMAERRVVVVRNVGGLKKEAHRAVERYVREQASSVSDVVLVLVSAGGEKAKADASFVTDAVCAVEFLPLEGHRIPKWIQHHVATELGATITDGAAALLQQAVGDDVPELAAELDKLASYTGGAIDEEAVTAVVGVRRGETLGDFLDRVAARNSSAALELLSHVLQQPKTTAVSIVMALTTQTLALAWAQARLATGFSVARLEQELFGLLKSSGGAFTGRPWGEAVRCWARYASAWSAPALDAAVNALLLADVSLKETRLSSDEQVLTTLVLALCAPTPAEGEPHHRTRRRAHAASRRVASVRPLRMSS
ncbi:MAG TPA: DNA polymerase III subunit delta [Gemmatimonadaceae bacterium]|nr:DNA polymerase III subunit delta [Gemmatimonadaceae bacterium]